MRFNKHKLISNMRNWRWWVGLPLALILAIPYFIVCVLTLVLEIVVAGLKWIGLNDKYLGAKLIKSILNWVNGG